VGVHDAVFPGWVGRGVLTPTQPAQYPSVALDSSYFTEHPELVTLLLLPLLLLSLLLLLLSQGHDVAVARAVADMRLLSEFCLPFVRPGGVWVAAKGANPEVSVSVTASVACVVAGLARKGGGACCACRFHGVGGSQGG
jgi:hypothetical protein